MAINNVYSQTPKRIYTNKPFINGMNYTNADLATGVCRAVANLELESSNTATKLRCGIENNKITDDGYICRFYSRYLVFHNTVSELQYKYDVIPEYKNKGIDIFNDNDITNTVTFYDRIIKTNTELIYRDALLDDDGNDVLGSFKDYQIYALRLSNGIIPHTIHNDDKSFTFYGIITNKNGTEIFKGFIKLYIHAAAQKAVVEIVTPKVLDDVTYATDPGVNLTASNPFIFKDFSRSDYQKYIMGVSDNKVLDIINTTVFDSHVPPYPDSINSTARQVTGISTNNKNIYIRPFVAIPEFSKDYAFVVSIPDNVNLERRLYYNFYNKTFDSIANPEYVDNQKLIMTFAKIDDILGTNTSREVNISQVDDPNYGVVDSVKVKGFSLEAYDAQVYYSGDDVRSKLKTIGIDNIGSIVYDDTQYVLFLRSDIITDDTVISSANGDQEYHAYLYVYVYKLSTTNNSVWKKVYDTKIDITSRLNDLKFTYDITADGNQISNIKLNRIYTTYTQTSVLFDDINKDSIVGFNPKYVNMQTPNKPTYNFPDTLTMNSEIEDNLYNAIRLWKSRESAELTINLELNRHVAIKNVYSEAYIIDAETVSKEGIKINTSSLINKTNGYVSFRVSFASLHVTDPNGPYEVAYLSETNMVHSTTAFIMITESMKYLDPDIYRSQLHITDCANNITQHLGHYVIYGDELGSNCLCYSDYGDLSYFPSNYVIEFDNPIVYVYSHMNNLIVFTTDDIYMLHSGTVPSTTAEDGNDVAFTKTLIQSNVRLGKQNIRTVRSVGKDLFFVSDTNDAYLLKTNKYVSSPSDTYLMKISNQISKLLEDPTTYNLSRLRLYGAPDPDPDDFINTKNDFVYDAINFTDDTISINAIEIIDGDTFKYNNEYYRCLFYNTPEHDKFGYEDATDYLNYIISKGELCIVDSGKLDAFNRKLVTVYTKYNNSYINIAKCMLKHGYATFYYNEYVTLEDNRPYIQYYEEAVKNGKGIHAKLEKPYIYAYVTNSYIYLIQINKGMTIIYKYSIDTRTWITYDVPYATYPVDDYTDNSLVGFKLYCQNSISGINNNTSVLRFNNNKYDTYLNDTDEHPIIVYFDSGNQSMNINHDKHFREVKLVCDKFPDDLPDGSYKLILHHDSKQVEGAWYRKFDTYEKYSTAKTLTFRTPCRGRVPRIVFYASLKDDINILEYAIVYIQTNAK